MRFCITTLRCLCFNLLGSGTTFNLVGHILHTHQERYGESGVGQLLSSIHSPKAVGQVVVLHATVALDLAVAAVVIGEQKALGRHKLARTTTSEEHNSIFQSRLVDAVNILGSELETLGTHIVNTLANQAGQPHTLVGHQRRQRCRNGNNSGQ